MRGLDNCHASNAFMRILHTADWHLGRTLYHKTRYEEFGQFLDWLLAAVQEHAIDALLVAGDVFDTTAPSNKAQGLYYGFLSELRKTCCRHVVITAGNHDSPTFLEAPRKLLKSFDVHVIGNVPKPIEKEVILLRDGHGDPELIVCAVPYLRDHEIRISEAGESLEAKEKKLREGIESHYAKVAAAAVQLRDSLPARIPIVAMGHLFTAGGETAEGDGVRSLYVGNLAHVESQIFPPCFDYVALGHLHVPQTVGNSETIRYSGSPIPMGFGEAGQKKSVCIVDWSDETQKLELLKVPLFQKLAQIKGDWPEIEAHLDALIQTSESTWLEVVYQGSQPMPDLRERVEKRLEGTSLESLRNINFQQRAQTLSLENPTENLQELDEREVFQRCLIRSQIPEEQWSDLKAAYQEILTQYHEEDPQAH